MFLRGLGVCLVLLRRNHQKDGERGGGMYFNILYLGEMEFDFTLEGEIFVGDMGLGKGWTKGLQTWNPARLG